MKLNRVLGVVIIIAIIAISFGYRQGVNAAQKEIAPAKVAVVDVSKVLQNSKKHKDWQQKMTEEEKQMKDEFDKAKAELEGVQKQMELLNVGSRDYISAMKEFLEKKGQLEAKDKFYQEKVNLEMLQWTQSLYNQMLEVAGKVARNKGIDLILAQEELDPQSPSLRDFMLNIRTKKVLYCSSQIDITDEVLAALDEAQ